MSAFSLDLKDLFVSLPQKCLFGVVRDCTDMFAEVSLQNKVGYSSGFFLELLQAYLVFLIVAFQEKKILVQNDGICIGAVIAHILSDLFLAKCDKDVQVKLPEGDVIRVLRYVDDYIVLLRKMGEQELTTLTKQFLDLLKKDANGLLFTVEMPERTG